MPSIRLGLEKCIASPPPYLRKARVGLLCNPASVDADLVHSRKRLKSALGNRLKALYSPQHGFFAEKQDNMIESNHRKDPLLGLPVFSLYSRTRIPNREMLDPIDVLLVDLQDVGTRVYTFIYTMSYCMEAARNFDKKVVILDRPNPIGGVAVEGNCLEPDMFSFVGRYPIPMRHGLTIGELARLFNDAYGIGCDLDVLPMAGWQRQMHFGATGLPWIAPSPNLPTPTSALVYPGQVIWEGTNVSEGRGTTQPFELFGAPFLDPYRVLDAVSREALEGAFLRVVEFEPTSNKWQGEICRGFQLHVTDHHRFKPYCAGLSLLQAIMHCHGEAFEWKAPPYEYEYDRMPIDLIIGDPKLRQQLSEMVPMSVLESNWQDGLSAFDTLRQRYFLYP
ncbi:MAG: DUF1343 domain-containing protein [Desulfobacteraceae bacterium]|jgi:uncharacterized protein YbbC (DUF1343 family)